MHLRFFIETSIFQTLLGISRVVPRRVLLGMGSAVGWLGYVFDSRHRGIALDNLRLAYGGHVDFLQRKAPADPEPDSDGHVRGFGRIRP